MEEDISEHQFRKEVQELGLGRREGPRWAPHSGLLFSSQVLFAYQRLTPNVMLIFSFGLLSEAEGREEGSWQSAKGEAME